jgi:hypothetical protein
MKIARFKSSAKYRLYEYMHTRQHFFLKTEVRILINSLVRIGAFSAQAAIRTK